MKETFEDIVYNYLKEEDKNNLYFKVNKISKFDEAYIIELYELGNFKRENKTQAVLNSLDYYSRKVDGKFKKCYTKKLGRYFESKTI